jgi:ribosomal protein S12 methylthiotransferase
MIVGFPGETEDDFEQLMEFVQDCRFDRLGVFTFSDEEDATSAGLNGKVESSIKDDRQRRLMELQAGISRENNARFLGQTVPVLLEGPSQESDLLWEGRTSTQAPDIDGVVYLTDGITEQTQPGEIRLVRVEEAHEHDLVGVVV